MGLPIVTPAPVVVSHGEISPEGPIPEEIFPSSYRCEARRAHDHMLQRRNG